MRTALRETYTISASKAAQAIGISAKTLMRWVVDGKVSAKRVGAKGNGRYFFRPADVERLAEGEIINPELAAS